MMIKKLWNSLTFLLGNKLTKKQRRELRINIYLIARTERSHVELQNSTTG